MARIKKIHLEKSAQDELALEAAADELLATMKEIREEDAAAELLKYNPDNERQSGARGESGADGGRGPNRRVTAWRQVYGAEFWRAATTLPAATAAAAAAESDPDNLEYQRKSEVGPRRCCPPRHRYAF